MATEPATCAMAGSATQIPAQLTGTTMDGVDHFADSECIFPDGPGSAPDIAFEFTAPAAGIYEFDTVGSAFDTVLSVRSTCDGPELECNDDIVEGRERQSHLSLDLEACETVILVVDGFAFDDFGDVVLNVYTSETMCGDGIDNDNDGLTDCDDEDCFSVECSGGDDWPMPWSDFEWQVLELTNQRRAEGADCGTEGSFGPAGPLEMDEVIREAARKHSLDMGEQDYFEHDSLDGRTFSDRMSEEGFMGAFPWGENIAAGQRTADAVVQGWMESDGHCANIMNPAFNTIGIGYAEVPGSSFETYWTQDFAASH